jgi:hypothetical protein
MGEMRAPIEIAVALKVLIDQRRKVESHADYPDVKEELLSELDKLIDRRLSELGDWKGVGR